MNHRSMLFLYQTVSLGSAPPGPILWAFEDLCLTMGMRTAASDWSDLEGGVAGESCFDWSSMTCCVRLAQGASWT